MHGCGGHAWLPGMCAWLRGCVWLQGGMHGCGGQHAWLQGGMCGCRGHTLVVGCVCVVAGACMVAVGHAWWSGGACMVARDVCMVVGGVCGCRGACMVVGGSMHGCRGACVVAGGMHGCGGCVWLQGHAWLQGACMVVRGACMVVGACMVAGGVHGIQRDTVNERGVRILLECILVSACHQYTAEHPGFPRGGRQPIIRPNFPKNCMKMKKTGPRGGHASIILPCRSATGKTVSLTEVSAVLSTKAGALY